MMFKFDSVKIKIGAGLSTGLLLLGSLTAQALPHAGSVPWLKVDGAWLKDEKNNNVTLRGVSLCEVSDGDAKKDISLAAQKWKSRVVRLPVVPGLWRAGQRATGDNVYVKTYLDPAIVQCVQEKVYCILDFHSVGGHTTYGHSNPREWNNVQTDKEITEFWNALAPRYKNISNVIYELFNEPTHPTTMTAENWRLWKGTAQKWVDLIRRHAPENIIIVGSPHYSQLTQFAPADPFKGKNLTYTMHLYPGWTMSYSGDKTKVQDFHNRFVGKAAQSVPVFITEWGFSPNGHGGFDPHFGRKDEYGAEMIDLMTRRFPNISWTAWAFHPRCAPALTTDRNGTPNDGPSWGGKLVQDTLIKFYDVYAPQFKNGTAPATPPPPVVTPPVVVAPNPAPVPVKPPVVVKPPVTPPKPPVTPVNPPAQPTTPSGNSTLEVVVSGDSYQGFPKLQIHRDWKNIINQDVKSAETKKQKETIKVNLANARSGQTIAIAFVNDLYRGAGKDRNMYVHSIKLNGKTIPLSSLVHVDKNKANLRNGMLFYQISSTMIFKLP